MRSLAKDQLFEKKIHLFSIQLLITRLHFLYKQGPETSDYLFSTNIMHPGSNLLTWALKETF